MSRHDDPTEPAFYAERLQAEDNIRHRLLAPMSRLEWYGSIGVAALMLVLLAWVL